MKKIISVLFFVALCFGTAFAQEAKSTELPSNALNITVADGAGEGATAMMAETMALVIKAIFNSDTDEKIVGWIPYFSLGYDHHFNDSRWSVGAETGYWHFAVRNNKSETPDIRHGNVGVAAATGKFYYKTRGFCKLYGGVNLGVGLTGVMNEKDGATTFEAPQVFPAFQLNPIGVRLGNEKVGFIAELGAGYRGIFQIGLSIALD